jgi:hypothetical protein
MHENMDVRIPPLRPACRAEASCEGGTCRAEALAKADLRLIDFTWFVPTRYSSLVTFFLPIAHRL